VYSLSPNGAAVGGRYEISEPKRTTEQKIRKCLICRSPFPSAWAGERICRRCKILRRGGAVLSNDRAKRDMGPHSGDPPSGIDAHVPTVDYSQINNHNRLGLGAVMQNGTNRGMRTRRHGLASERKLSRPAGVQFTDAKGSYLLRLHRAACDRE
jgi:hypothetical protein